MDYRILKTVDVIREFFGKPCTINNWHLGGSRTNSGYRTPLTATGARWSQHRFGRAVDMLIKDVDAETARKEILKEKNHFPYVTVIEDKVSWLHVDCRAVSGSDIVLIKP
jgi:hypothetical protein